MGTRGDPLRSRPQDTPANVGVESSRFQIGCQARDARGGAGIAGGKTPVRSSSRGSCNYW